MSEYPDDLMNQLKPDDKVIIFQKLDLKNVYGDIFGPVVEVKPGEGFIAVTERRLVIKASEINTITAQGNKVVKTSKLQTINVPIGNVSSITVQKDTTPSGGCLGGSTEDYSLVINVQGGIYHIYSGVTSQIADEFVRSFIDLQE